MDPFRFCLAVEPVALYLFVLGLLNLRRRATVVSGFRDLLALCLALSGMAVVGPLELFLPESSVYRFGPNAWLLIVVLYCLGVLLLLLTLRSRTVIYNMRIEQLRPILADVVFRLDERASWANDTAQLPSLGVHLHVESSPFMRNIQLVAVGRRQDLPNWLRMEQQLRSSLKDSKTASNPRAIGLFVTSVLILVLAFMALTSSPDQAAQALVDFLRLNG